VTEPFDQQAYQDRQRSKAKVMAFLLGAFVILIFAIAIVRMKEGG
jgi:hypothetical protein